MTRQSLKLVLLIGALGSVRCSLGWNLDEEFAGASTADGVEDVGTADSEVEADVAPDSSDDTVIDTGNEEVIDDPVEDVIEEDIVIDSDDPDSDDVSDFDSVDEDPDVGDGSVDGGETTEFCDSGADDDGDGDVDCDDADCTTAPVCGGFTGVGDYFDTSEVDIFLEQPSGEFTVSMVQQFAGTWIYTVAVDPDLIAPGSTTFTTDALFDTYCYLFDPDTLTIATFDDDGGDGTNCRIDLTTTNAPVFEIVIVEFNGTQVLDLPTLYAVE